MPEHQDRIVAALMERLIAHGPEQMGEVFAALFNLALRLEREGTVNLMTPVAESRRSKVACAVRPPPCRP